MAENNHYEAENITVLEGLEAVRKRPGMYIGSTGERGLHHLVWEIVDNSIDEALAGYCTHIEVEVLPGDIISVTDNGRGMPIGVHPKTKRPAVETIFTVLHAGGKFDDSNYKVSGGLHGVGASVVNALSEWLTVEVSRDGKKYAMSFARGKVSEELHEIGTSDYNGSKVIFKADPLIFHEMLEDGTQKVDTVYDYETLRHRVQELAFLNKGLGITITDSRNSDNIVKEHYMYEGGIKEYVSFINKNKDIINNNIIYIEKEVDRITVEIAIQYNTDFHENVYSFTNNIHTTEGGYHEDGFKMALNRKFNDYAFVEKNKLLVDGKDEKLNYEDNKEGLTAIISVKHPDPQFEGQTKTKLGNTEVRRIVSQVLSECLERFFLENPSETRLILEKCIRASKAHQKARKMIEVARKDGLENGLGGDSKLTDCRCKDPEKCELYIVEGDSAGGSAKQGREPQFQAILPLRGKVLNVEKASEEKILDNREILTLIQCIGAGTKDNFDVTKARYHKIVIMADADVDGEHITTLLLTFFYRYMPQLIEAGYVYVACPPLYKIEYSQKNVHYAYSDQELEKIKALNPNSRASIQRYKGLGEMDASQLWETTMDPANRILIRVVYDPERKIEADQTFSMLMGEEVEPRRKFIEENAVYAEIDS